MAPMLTASTLPRLHSPVGAGDTFIAGMLLGLVRNNWPLSGSNISKAASFAVKLATLKVQREGFQGLAVDIAEG
jgi:ketohexokinase